MKFIRFKRGDSIEYGIIEGQAVRAVAGDPLKTLIKTKELLKIEEISVIAPLSPSKIVAVGLNYKDHAAELDLPLPEEPLIFLKPPSSVIGPCGTIYYPPQTKRLDYEAELAIVIKKRAHRVPEALAKDYIFGYTCLNHIFRS